MLPQYKWKLEDPKDREAQTKNMSNKNYHWCPHHEMWTYHNPENCELGKIGIENMSD